MDGKAEPTAGLVHRLPNGGAADAELGGDHVGRRPLRLQHVTVLEHDAIGLPAGQVTCPAFGGPGLSVLYVTSASDGAGKDDRLSGATFAVPTGFKGQRAHRVVV